MLGKLKSLLGLTPQIEQKAVPPTELPEYVPLSGSWHKPYEDATRPSLPISRHKTTEMQKALDLAG